ncbi:MAG: hypothetical protein OXU66_03420 [Gammaproteobacteria bacterium]|nr:hypothetical protein [Gammaproteobacteria bacterium]
MKILISLAQVLGLFILVPAVVIVTLWLDARGGDGPSVIFRGGVFTAGEIYQGPEPDWSFTDEIRLIELQLNATRDSRTTFIIESNGRIFVTSDYMGTVLGRLWKKWAVEAAEGDGAAEIRIGDTRYLRTMRRITEGPELDWVIEAKIAKYGGILTQEMIGSGETWVFEFEPRGQG